MQVTVKKLRQIIKEEYSLSLKPRKFTLSENQKTALKRAIRESTELRAQGYNTRDINEGVLETILSIPGIGPFLATFVSPLTTQLVSYIGLDPEGFAAESLGNFMEESVEDPEGFANMFSQTRKM